MKAKRVFILKCPDSQMQQIPVLDVSGIETTTQLSKAEEEEEEEEMQQMTVNSVVFEHCRIFRCIWSRHLVIL